MYFSPLFSKNKNVQSFSPPLQFPVPEKARSGRVAKVFLKLSTIIPKTSHIFKKVIDITGFKKQMALTAPL